MTSRRASGRRIRAARQRAGLTQQRLAEAIGAGRVTVVRWEHGQQEPSIHQAAELAKALGMSLDQLFGPEEED
jgi:transcriptional regulator with XRE-family HTH domain